MIIDYMLLFLLILVGHTNLQIWNEVRKRFFFSISPLPFFTINSKSFLLFERRKQMSKPQIEFMKINVCHSCTNGVSCLKPHLSIAELPNVGWPRKLRHGMRTGDHHYYRRLMRSVFGESHRLELLECIEKKLIILFLRNCTGTLHVMR